MDRKQATKAITFITPTLDRKGSEIALVNLLQQINTSFQIKLIAKYKGVLFDLVLKSVNKAFLFDGKPKRTYYHRIKARLAIKARMRLLLGAEADSVFYINTIILPDVLAFAQQKKIKTIVHIHELEQMYTQLNLLQIQRLVAYPDLIIANSKASAAVIDNYGRRENVEICYPSLNTENIKPDKKSRDTYRKKLNIADNAFLWVMSGSLDKNKNPFLFIDIAGEILKTKSNVKFMWIGGTVDTSFEKLCKDKTVEGKLSDSVIWLGDVAEEYYGYMNCADGFVLTSEKESFSLVTVEALLLGLPVVTQNCGGVKEILQNDIGKIVEEKNDVVRMAVEMMKFMGGEYKVDKEKQTERAKQFDSVAIGKHWNDILERYFNKG